MEELACVGPECDRTALGPSDQLCATHRAQKLRGKGLTPIGSTIPKKRDEKCAASFCDRPVKGTSDWCRAHDRQRKNGQELTPVRTKDAAPPQPLRKRQKPSEPVDRSGVVYRRTRICIVRECGRKATAGETCGYHVSDERFAGRPVCKEETCLRPRTFIPSTGYCVEHGRDAA